MILTQRNVSNVNIKIFCSIYDGDTPLPPCVLRTTLFWPCVLRSAIFWPCVLHTVKQQKTTILVVSIYIYLLYKEDKITVCCMHMYVQLFLKTLSTVFVLVKLTRFCIPKSMFKFINAEMTP